MNALSNSRSLSVPHPPAFAEQFAAALHDCHVVQLGPGAHYLQEDHSERIGRVVGEWIAGIEGGMRPAQQT